MEEYGNASSQHKLGFKARKAIACARKQVAKAIDCEPHEIIFTSGGSEGNTWVLHGKSRELCERERAHLITTSIEHHSVLNACKNTDVLDVTYLNPDSDGRVSVSNVESALRPNTKLVTIMFANNEIGTIQPVQQIGEMLKSHNVMFHTDAVQAVGHIPISMKKLKVDFLTASAHKFNGPKGIGFIFIRDGIAMPNYIFGGEQEFGLRSGTENVAGIVALGYALEECVQNLGEDTITQQLLVKMTIEKLKKSIPNLIINAELANRLPGILNITFENATGEAMMHLLSLKDICVSAGAACNSNKGVPSHVLLAIGKTESEAKNSIRISYGRYNTVKEVDEITSAIKSAYFKITQAKST
jgi:cysteine desulfurase